MQSHIAHTDNVSAILAYRETLTRTRSVALVSQVALAARLSTSEVISAMRSLEASGVGVFVVGRKGGVSRFVWYPLPKRVRTPVVRRAPRLPLAAAPPPPVSASVKGLSYDIPIRDGQAHVRVVVPFDITPSEALKVADVFMGVSDRLSHVFDAAVAKAS